MSPEALYSVIAPDVVMRPIRPGLAFSVKYSAPSLPSAIPCGFELAVSPKRCTR